MASVRDLNIRELTVKKLTQLDKKRGLKGYSKNNKSELADKRQIFKKNLQITNGIVLLTG